MLIIDGADLVRVLRVRALLDALLHVVLRCETVPRHAEVDVLLDELVLAIEAILRKPIALDIEADIFICINRVRGADDTELASVGAADGSISVVGLIDARVNTEGSCARASDISAFHEGHVCRERSTVARSRKFCSK